MLVYFTFNLKLLPQMLVSFSLSIFKAFSFSWLAVIIYTAGKIIKKLYLCTYHSNCY